MKRLLVIFFILVSTNSYANNNKVTISAEGAFRIIQSNGIPDHTPGRFPNQNNPNAISAQNYNFRVPLNPKLAGRTTPLRRQPFGIGINGVPFDPGTAEYWNNDRQSGWNYEALSGKIKLGLDSNNAHVQPTGAYHYHGNPEGLVAIEGGNNQLTLIGYAADGFPIYSLYGYNDPNDSSSGIKKMKSGYGIKNGNRGSGPRGRYDGTFVQDYEYKRDGADLDECNGLFGVTPEYPKGIYHYYITDTFPFVPRCFKGTPDSSFERRGSRPQRQGEGRPSRGRLPPREAISSCASRDQGIACQFQAPHGTIKGTCHNLGGYFACLPSNHRPPRGPR